MKKLCIVFVLAFIATSVFASDEGHHHHMPSTEQMMPSKMMEHPEHKMFEEPHFMHHQNLKGRATPSAQAYAHINHTMHEGMNIDFTGDADIDFLRGMIPHHQGAVNMAEVQLEHGIDGLLKSLTQQIIRDQEREIRIMKRLLAVLEEQHSNHHHKSKSSHSTQAFRRLNHAMHMDMDIRYSGNADIDFVNGMIPHHRGAVDMAWVVIKHGKDSNVRNLAYEVVNAQESEITWMKRWNHRQRLMRAFR